jgi:hypothetical protein
MSADLGTMSGDLARGKLPSSQIRVHRLDVGRPRDDVRGSDPMEATVATDPRTSAGCRLTSGRCPGIWPEGSFRRPRSTYIGWMSADLGTMSGDLAQGKLPSSQIRAHRPDVGRPRDDVRGSGPREASVVADPRTSAGCRPTLGRCPGIWPEGSYGRPRSTYIGWMPADLRMMSGDLTRWKLTSSQIRVHRLDVGRPRDDVRGSDSMEATVAVGLRTLAELQLIAERCRGIWLVPAVPWVPAPRTATRRTRYHSEISWPRSWFKTSVPHWWRG